MASAFLRRLDRLDVDPERLGELDAALGPPQAVERNARLFREGAHTDVIYFVEQGWLTAQDQLQDGSAFYRAVYLPGDIAGLAELAWSVASADLVALTDATVRSLSRGGLDRILREHARLASLMLTMSVVQQTAIADRHAQALKSDGRGRLIYFLLDLHARQSIEGEVDWMELPMTQVQIANAVGLSNVHVNVLLRSLEDEGLVERRRNGLRFLDRAGLAGEVGYRERWTNIDFTWLTGFARHGAQEAG